MAYGFRHQNKTSKHFSAYVCLQVYAVRAPYSDLYLDLYLEVQNDVKAKR